MAKTNRIALEKIITDKIACGRSLEEQLGSVRAYGNHGASPMLRAGALAAHGIANPKASAPYAVLFGCYRPFTTPFLLQDALRLLDILEVEHTWLEKEYCCGLPLLGQAPKEERQEVASASAGFVRQNWELAKAKGAGTLVYCCAGCATAAKHMCPDTQHEHVYVLDLLLDRLEGRPLRVEPMTLGYFEGCHATFRMHYPKTSLPWARYREFLDTVEGLTLVDLPGGRCCKHQASEIVGSAVERGLSGIVSPCSGCNVGIREAGRGKARMVSYPELLLMALGGAQGAELGCGREG